MNVESAEQNVSRTNRDQIIVVNLFARGSTALLVRLRMHAFSRSFSVLLVAALPFRVSSCLCTQDYDAFVMTPDGECACEISVQSVIDSSFMFL